MAASLLLGLLAVLLLIAAATDLRARDIANRLNLAIALLAPAFWWATGLEPWPGVAVQLALAAIVFALFATAFAFGWMGGGDVKLLSAIALWLPLYEMLRVVVLTSLIGGVLTIGFVVLHRIRNAQESPEIPYGVAIAAAGLWVIGERYLNQFA